jgi:hypothetical protein
MRNPAMSAALRQPLTSVAHRLRAAGQRVTSQRVTALRRRQTDSRQPSSRRKPVFGAVHVPDCWARGTDRHPFLRSRALCGSLHARLFASSSLRAVSRGGRRSSGTAATQWSCGSLFSQSGTRRSVAISRMTAAALPLEHHRVGVAKGQGSSRCRIKTRSP